MLNFHNDERLDCALAGAATLAAWAHERSEAALVQEEGAAAAAAAAAAAPARPNVCSCGDPPSCSEERSPG